jgi:hypothetical protein
MRNIALTFKTSCIVNDVVENGSTSRSASLTASPTYTKRWCSYCSLYNSCDEDEAEENGSFDPLGEWYVSST